MFSSSSSSSSIPNVQLTSGTNPAYNNSNVIVLPDLNGSYTFLAGHMENFGFSFPKIKGQPFVAHYREEESVVQKHLSRTGIMSELKDWLSSSKAHRLNNEVKGTEFFNALEAQLSQATYDGKERKIILIGDTLHDRATNSLAMLMLFKHLKQAEVDLDIIYSNHDFMAVKVYQVLKSLYEANKDKSFGTNEDAIKAVLLPVIDVLSSMFPAPFQYSMINCVASLGKMMKESSKTDEALVPIKKFIDLFETDYFPYVSIVKAIDMQVEQGYGKYLFSHAPCPIVPALPLRDGQDPEQAITAMFAQYKAVISNALQLKFPGVKDLIPRINHDISAAIGKLSSSSTNAQGIFEIKQIYRYLFDEVMRYEQYSLTGLLDKLYHRAISREKPATAQHQAYIDKHHILLARQAELVKLLSLEDQGMPAKKKIHEHLQVLVAELASFLSEARNNGEAERILLATCVSHFVQNRISVFGEMAEHASQSIMNVHGHMGRPNDADSYYHGINTTANPDIGSASRLEYQQKVFFGNEYNPVGFKATPLVGSPALKIPSLYDAPGSHEVPAIRKRPVEDNGTASHEKRTKSENEEPIDENLLNYFKGPGSPKAC